MGKIIVKENFMYISKRLITCKNCGEQYYLIEENYSMRDKDKLPCEKCGFILKNWDNAVIYSLEPVSEKEVYIMRIFYAKRDYSNLI